MSENSASRGDFEAYDDALRYLLGRINYEQMPSPPYAERRLKLDRMRRLLARLDSPDAGLPIVHVAGTKGKGSTSAILAAIVQAANYRVGVFSSPHLDRIEERFAVDGLPCSADCLVRLVERVRPVVAFIDQQADEAPDAQLRPTFFEIVTALSILHFADRQVDLAVLEVGLGGRLDATNVCLPRVTAITSISYDHTQQLGDTLCEIAGEKAGILKPGAPVVVGTMPQEARAVIEQTARERGCRTIVADRDFSVSFLPNNHIAFIGRDGDERFELPATPLRLRGRHQANNAAVAIALALEMRQQGWLISADAIRRGLAKAVLAGRIEVFGENPTVVLDVAHNVASAKALAECIRLDFPAQRRILLLAATREKDAAGIAAALLPLFEQVVITEYQGNARAVPADELARICRDVIQEGSATRTGAPAATPDLAVVPTALDAWTEAQRLADPDDLICITGSFFVAAELRKTVAADAAARQQRG